MTTTSPDMFEIARSITRTCSATNVYKQYQTHTHIHKHIQLHVLPATDVELPVEICRLLRKRADDKLLKTIKDRNKFVTAIIK